jgi:hypothetical protein
MRPIIGKDKKVWRVDIAEKSREAKLGQQLHKMGRKEDM